MPAPSSGLAPVMSRGRNERFTLAAPTSDPSPAGRGEPFSGSGGRGATRVPLSRRGGGGAGVGASAPWLPLLEDSPPLPSGTGLTVGALSPLRAGEGPGGGFPALPSASPVGEGSGGGAASASARRLARPGA